MKMTIRVKDKHRPYSWLPSPPYSFQAFSSSQVSPPVQLLAYTAPSKEPGLCSFEEFLEKLKATARIVLNYVLDTIPCISRIALDQGSHRPWWVFSFSLWTLAPQVARQCTAEAEAATEALMLEIAGQVQVKLLERVSAKLFDDTNFERCFSATTLKMKKPEKS